MTCRELERVVGQRVGVRQDFVDVADILSGAGRPDRNAPGARPAAGRRAAA